MKVYARAGVLIGLIVVMLAACTGGGTSALDDTAWQLLWIEGDPPVGGGSLPTLTFEAGGEVSGQAGCNSFGGSYKLRGSIVSFSDLFSTAMACLDDDAMSQEARYLDILRSADRYELRDGLLIIEDAQGRTLIFEPR